MQWLRRHPVYAGGLVLLLSAILITAVLRAWQVRRVAESGASRQAAIVEDALEHASNAFGELRRHVQQRACRLARDPAVTSALQRTETESSSREQLVQRLTKESVSERWGFEVYDREAFLQAWKGANVPFATPGVPDSRQVAVVADGEVRWALAAWCPVQSRDTTVGMVRAVRLIRFRVPVQNKHISDYSLAETWSRQTGRSVEVELGGEVSSLEADPASSRLLRAEDGQVLGRVIVQPPTAGQLVQETRRHFDDMLALWAALLLLWGVAGGWMWYRAAAPGPEAQWTSLLRAARRWVIVAVAWWGTRYGLIALDVPARWQPSSSKAPLAPLFDPTHLASTFGSGLMRSAGDLLVTGLFAALFAAAALHLAASFRQRAATLSELRAQLHDRAEAPSVGRFGAVVVGTALLAAGLTWSVVRLVQHAVIDSTLDFFARTGLLPEPLVLVVLCGLLFITVAVVLSLVAWLWGGLHAMARYRPEGVRGIVIIGAGALGLGIVLGAAPLLGEYHVVTGGFVLILWSAIVAPTGLGLLQQRQPLVAHITLRSLLSAILGVTLLLYPLLYSGMDTQRRGRMVDALQSFEEGQNPQVSFALEQMLRAARRDSTLRRTLMQPEAAPPARIDSMALRLLRESLVASLEEYETTLLFLDAERRLQGRYTATGARLRRESLRPEDATAFQALRAEYATQPTGDPLVRQQADRRRDAAWYEGLVALSVGQDREPAGWVWVQSEPRSVLPGADAPFPRIFLPDGLYSDVYAELSLAEFRDDRLVRSLGGDFTRVRLSHAVQQALQGEPTVWQRERVHGRTYFTYYERQEAPPGPSVSAVRVPAVTSFDHLYYLLRLAVAGLCIGGPFYLIGLVLRYRCGLLPAPRIRFRDKVLDAFLAVGAVSVVAVGLVGMGVVTEETDHAVESLLQQNLERVEDALLYEARRGEQPYAVVDRIGIDSLAAQVGIDLNLYEGERLVETSRPRLIRDRLMEARLPLEAYRALYLDASRFVTVEERYGKLSYAAGFHALVDAEGRPRYVISSPTLPEQERIKEERARTLASLFGALLLMLVIVMGTALFLARALTKPIARLRAGLEAVGEGRFTRKLPVETRDEIGELVRTFNEMREQLAESRRQLAQQERELAWREMARQVAHEIKNPLTPMKLSVQHLRRAFEQRQVAIEAPEPSDTRRARMEDDEQFATLFDRITGTLIEQINALAHIANEFSTFARLPTRMPEPLDLNEVIREATSLMREEADVEIALDLHDDPLVVEADQEELRRIYINLIKNAIQAIPDDRPGRIEITSERRPPGDDKADAAPQVYSTVADNGIGIPEEQRNKIFQPNFSTKTSGTGLGLAIAKRSIEELDGAIGFETTEGKGTTFWIQLPQDGEPEEE